MKKVFIILVLFVSLAQAQTPADSLNITPNPFQKRTCAFYSFSQNDTVSLTVYNVIGQTILSLKTNSVMPSGNYQDSLIMDSYPDGIYFVHLKLGARKKIIKKISKTFCASFGLFAANGPVSCMGACDATATVYVLNGTPPYSYTWTPISVNTRTVSGLCAGTYTIDVNDSNNCSGRAYLIINNPSNPCVGILEFHLDNKISIYPNPVSNILHIESEKYFDEGTEIQITNAIGQAFIKTSFKSEMDLTSLPSGLYFLRINDKEENYISKFIKE